MAKIRHVNCPKCGGTLGMSGMERVIKCRYCATWSLVDVPGLVPEYYVEPKINEMEARRIVQSFLRDKDLPDGLLKNTHFHSAKMCFIPYHEMTGRRLGTMTTTEEKQQRASGPKFKPSISQSSMGGWGGVNEHVGVRDMGALKPKEKKVDTRVIMSDLTRNEPAIHLKAWALEEADVTSVRSDPSGLLQSMNRRKMEKLGKVYDPTITTEHMLSKITTTAGAANLVDDTEIAEVKVKRIYYPIWRIRYKYQGRLYGVTVDGVSGKIMAARAPQADGSRVLWMLGTTAMVAFIMGKVGHALVSLIFFDPESMGVLLQMMTRGIVVVAPVVIFSLLLVLVVLGFGWEQFRYPGEIVVTGKRREVEKINRPDRTVFDVASELLSGMLGNFMPGKSSQGRSI